MIRNSQFIGSRGRLTRFLWSRGVFRFFRNLTLIFESRVSKRRGLCTQTFRSLGKRANPYVAFRRCVEGGNGVSRAKRHVPGVMLVPCHMCCVMTPSDSFRDRLSPGAAGLSNCRRVADNVWLLGAALFPHKRQQKRQPQTT